MDRQTELHTKISTEIERETHNTEESATKGPPQLSRKAWRVPVGSGGGADTVPIIVTPTNCLYHRFLFVCGGVIAEFGIIAKVDWFVGVQTNAEAVVFGWWIRS